MELSFKPTSIGCWLNCYFKSQSSRVLIFFLTIGLIFSLFMDQFIYLSNFISIFISIIINRLVFHREFKSSAGVNFAVLRVLRLVRVFRIFKLSRFVFQNAIMMLERLSKRLHHKEYLYFRYINTEQCVCKMYVKTYIFPWTISNFSMHYKCYITPVFVLYKHRMFDTVSI